MRFTRDELLSRIKSGRIPKRLLISSNFEQSILTEFDIWVGSCSPTWGFWSKLHSVYDNKVYGDESMAVKSSSSYDFTTLWHPSMFHYSWEQEGLDSETGDWVY